jgi:hypothetical protein
MPTRAQRPRLPETSAAQHRARQVWNGGLVGSARNGDHVPLVHTCTAPGCTQCAAIDRARTDLRTGGHGSGAR